MNFTRKFSGGGGNLFYYNKTREGEIGYGALRELVEKILKNGDIVDDFNLKNRKSHSLASWLHTQRKVYLINENQWKRKVYLIIENERKRKKTNSPVLYEFSRVGFSKDRKFALIYTSHYCGSLCARSGFELYENKNVKWEHLESLATLLS